MKKLILLSAILLSLAFGATAQTTENTWKVSLGQLLVKQFPYTAESARQLIDLKESFFKRMQAYQMPHVESQIGREAKYKALADLRSEEAARFLAILKEEAKAKEVSTFLEGRIPNGSGGMRRR